MEGGEGATIEDEQWEAARTAFMAGITETEGITEEKYSRLVSLLQQWDDLTPGQRREQAGGNQKLWYDKYTVSQVCQ